MEAIESKKKSPRTDRFGSDGQDGQGALSDGDVVGDAEQGAGVGDLGAGQQQRRPEPVQVGAVAAPRIGRQVQLLQKSSAIAFHKLPVSIKNYVNYVKPSKTQ